MLDDDGISSQTQLMFIYVSASAVCTGYPGHVSDYPPGLPMMAATTESVFLNLLVKNEPEDLTGHRERQGNGARAKLSWFPHAHFFLSRLNGRLHLLLAGDRHSQAEPRQADHGHHQHRERRSRHPAQ